MLLSGKSKSGYFAHFLFLIKRLDILICISIFIFTLILFESMAPTLLSSANFGSDGGDYLTAVLTNGIPHPTGYPIYLIISSFFQKFFSNTHVWRQVQLSILPGALSVLLLFVLSQFAGKNVKTSINLLTSALSAIFLAVSPLFWSQAVIIEVYSLNAFFICLGLLWFALITKNWQSNLKSRQVVICLLSWICGLGIGNHTTYIFIFPLVIYNFIKLHRSGMNKVILLFCIFGWFSGLFSYIILPFRAASNPPVNWGNPSSLNGFFWLVTGGDYGQNFFAIQPLEYISRIGAFISLIKDQFGYLGFSIGIIGLLFPSGNKILRFSTIYLFSIFSIFSIGYKTNDSFVYIIPGLICFSLWIGWGIAFLLKLNFANIKWGMISSALLVLNLIFVIPDRYNTINPQNGDLANYAEQSLSNSPINAILTPNTDGETFALWYYQHGLGLRKDVVIISKGLLKYDWYRDQLEQQYPNVSILY